MQNSSNLGVFKNSQVIGNKIRLNWALNTAYGDQNYCLFCKNAKQAIKIATALEKSFPNGENFSCLMDLSTLMLKGFELVETNNKFDFPYLILILNKFYYIQYSELKFYTIDEIKHLL